MLRVVKFFIETKIFCLEIRPETNLKTGVPTYFLIMIEWLILRKESL
jgi:hypothetical protein